MKKKRSKLEEIGHELKTSPPRVLAKTRKKKGAKQAGKQRVAILLSKARKAGVKVPARSKRGRRSRPRA
jgi:hypothetical protein